ncbi:RNA polymerase sigma-70 factor (ECF subfamily) [Paenibacillus anaericanus]|uniref:RNA polymerase sigma factor n=1 Tax=Paenibacillus anaericanus TaxID=170367 RepID=UPI00278827BF|nr:RNA polymerase sigma factor [Paenibacillus anaericanus]MDQ0091026.1 RNA polymerase sigma-70 factor (ECF subfamily) [Paenibacillus anaericanus]
MDSRAVVTDEQLLMQFKQGNTAVLELFVYRYHQTIYAYLYRLTSKRQLAEDLAQECFVRVFTALQAGRLPERFRPWIYRIATNLCRDVWKSGAYRYEVTAKDTGVYDAADGGKDTVASFLDKQYEREAVIAALGALPEEERQIVILRFYEELKLEEIAELLELPLGTVKSKLYRAFRRLADILQKGEDQDELHFRKRERR